MIALVTPIITLLAFAANNPLHGVHTFMYQLQELEQKVAVHRLAQSNYDMLVVEPMFFSQGNEKFDAKGMVKQLHEGKPGRLVIAYADVGQAESYRTYWTKNWKKPTRGAKGSPDFILSVDPDGWTDNYPVAYWDRRWQEIWTGENGLIGQIMDAGFDGVYLDWIDGWEDEHVDAEAKRVNVHPAKAMVEFIESIRTRVQEHKASGVVIAQNGAYLIDRVPKYAKVIDGIGFEDTWFGGKANAKWGTPRAGDIANTEKEDSSTSARIKQYHKFIDEGVAVFTIDYCLDAENARKVYAASAKHGFVPLVTQVSLEKITGTPPPGLKK